MHDRVKKYCGDPMFASKYGNNGAPLAIMAFAKLVEEKVLNTQHLEDFLLNSTAEI